MRVDPATPGLQIDYAGRQYVASDRAAAGHRARRPQAVAGVNGDFFDICDTGAPLGVGRDRQRGVLHGGEEGWNTAFYLDRNGPVPHRAARHEGEIVQHPELHITNVNSPSVRPGGIGALHRQVGAAGPVPRGGRGQEHVRDGRGPRRPGGGEHDRSSRTACKVQGQVLVGRGRGADQLARLRPGSADRVGRPVRRAAQGGDHRQHPDAAQAGRRLGVDDVEMHPRTAVGIDRDTGEILMLVIDGRQDFSRGYTMVELANLMREFGAEDAINLDGGGSSTMVGARPPARSAS